MIQPRAIAVLSPGDMGSAVGRVLREGGARVLTCVEGRSEATRRRAEDAGMVALPSLEGVVQQADLLVSIVPPLAAKPLAYDVAAAAAHVGARVLYCDANSIGPGTARTIEGMIVSAGGAFVDGGIIGGSGGLRRSTVLYLSGEAAPEVAQLLEPIRTTIVGPEAGQASGVKILYAGLTKGLSALGTELTAGAERLGIRELLLEKYRAGHTDVARFFESTLPSLPPVARRRAEEMLELAETLESLGLGGHMARAAQATLDSVADRQAEQPAPEGGDLATFLTWWTHGISVKHEE